MNSGFYRKVKPAVNYLLFCYSVEFHVGLIMKAADEYILLVFSILQ